MEEIVFDPPRDLTDEERSILDFVIEANPDHQDTLRALFRDTKVTRVCSCGCGSPSLSIDRSAVERHALTWGIQLPGEVVAKIEGTIWTAMLFIAHEREDDDGDASLEFNHWGTEAGATRLPHPDELEVARFQPDGRGGRILKNFPPSDDELLERIRDYRATIAENPGSLLAKNLRTNLRRLEEDAHKRGLSTDDKDDAQRAV